VDRHEKGNNNNNNNNNNNKCLQSLRQFSAPGALDIQATDRLQFVLTMGIKYLTFLLEYLLKQCM
jgi:hypothetical protein